MTLRRALQTFAALAVALAARGAHAQESERPTEPAEPRFQGRAVYVGLGGGVVTDLGAATENWRVQAALPLARWLAVELYPYGYHFVGEGHHGPESVVALGIGAGLRVSPWPLASVRPYAAARFSHIHFWPDPWGEHEGTGTDSYSHTSHHRWAGALAAGFDGAPFSAQRLRLGLEIEGTLASGPGTSGSTALLGMVGWAL